MTTSEHNAGTVLVRNGIVLLGVGLVSAVCVYIGNEWFHTVFLPALGIGAAVGDALGDFFIIIVAFIGQRLASLAFFDDIYFGLLGYARQLQMAKEAMQTELGELGDLASTDKLTGAWNRRRFEELIRGEMERLARYDHALSLLMIDIDHFKTINDTHGHNIGDQVLVALTALLRSSLRSSDSLTRWGGEEFVLLCPSATLSTAVALAERLKEKINHAAFETAGRVTVSIGVAECVHGEEWQQWLNRADTALYRAKRNGRNQVQFAPETAVRDGAETRPASFVQLSWRKAYECGHEIIDRDHRALFSIANDLLNATFSGRAIEETRGIVEQLMTEVAKHFRREEAIIAAMGFPDAPAHFEMHRALLSKATQLLSAFEAGTLEVGALFQFLAQDMVAAHILGADRLFFPYLKHQDDQGLSANGRGPTRPAAEDTGDRRA